MLPAPAGEEVDMVSDVALGAVAGAAATALLQGLLGNHLSRQRNIRSGTFPNGYSDQTPHVLKETPCILVSAVFALRGCPCNSDGA